MFEKEAEEILNNHCDCELLPECVEGIRCRCSDFEERKELLVEGIEFGYNKAKVEAEKIIKNLRSQTMVEFVSYSGVYPCLCGGNLVVRIDGEEVNLGRCLRSGGECYFSSGWEAHVNQGDWKIDELPAAYEKYREEIEKVVNENVTWGCCGGCL